MEMEHINENTIRVLIENADLEERGITFLDLLGNHKQIESFFYSILEEVDVDEQFHESDAITFQVLPNGNGLELFISKGGGLNEQFDLSELPENSTPEDFTEFVKKQILNSSNELDEIDSYLQDPELLTSEVILKLNQFEDMISLANMMYLDNAVSNLYSYQGSYFLQLVFFVEEMTETSVEDEIAIALEFTEETQITADVLGEYGKLIMEKSALELTRHYFK
ncbi:MULTISPECIES: adaptor protein MecA [Carnobacterium]|jgi:adapter protein MecA 1/2|uniref:Adapter protein MecA n=2 Tax=Carnobacterium maltaromaticum TaxID=2751 RepID=K8EJ95_CARML|nr:MULTISPECIES: adaptor protein MecA [Carnobacterium]AOA02557.1 adaptor protein MecA [Carnobacterium maltaromaticum]KRN59933.1 adaptor protein [Carnobacterium maltaromaticum DSM 20342]KRN73249.1 adaptor protein [Carnobacterium maltaromaticum]KRN85569.1 adaptor protein [Carnobacterium maltaromaticum]MBC9807799.1 adaptor protein MecA [Carnobacterium maltaromaticum]